MGFRKSVLIASALSSIIFVGCKSKKASTPPKPVSKTDPAKTGEVCLALTSDREPIDPRKVVIANISLEHRAMGAGYEKPIIIPTLAQNSKIPDIYHIEACSETNKSCVSMDGLVEGRKPDIGEGVLKITARGCIEAGFVEWKGGPPEDLSERTYIRHPNDQAARTVYYCGDKSSPIFENQKQSLASLEVISADEKSVEADQKITKYLTDYIQKTREYYNSSAGLYLTNGSDNPGIAGLNNSSVDDLVKQIYITTAGFNKDLFETVKQQVAQAQKNSGNSLHLTDGETTKPGCISKNDIGRAEQDGPTGITDPPDLPTNPYPATGGTGTATEDPFDGKDSNELFPNDGSGEVTSHSKSGAVEIGVGATLLVVGGAATLGGAYLLYQNRNEAAPEQADGKTTPDTPEADVEEPAVAKTPAPDAGKPVAATTAGSAPASTAPASATAAATTAGSAPTAPATAPASATAATDTAASGTPEAAKPVAAPTAGSAPALRETVTTAVVSTATTTDKATAVAAGAEGKPKTELPKTPVASPTKSLDVKASKVEPSKGFWDGFKKITPEFKKNIGIAAVGIGIACLLVGSIVTADGAKKSASLTSDPEAEKLYQEVLEAEKKVKQAFAEKIKARDHFIEVMSR